MQYRGKDVAYLSYEMNHKPILLLISSSSGIKPSGDESYQSGRASLLLPFGSGLAHHHLERQGSDLDAKGADSCVICHGAEGERRKFEGISRGL
jgi:cytochrome c553